MEIQSSHIPFPTVRGTVQRSSRSLVTHLALPGSQDTGLPAARRSSPGPDNALTAPSPLQQANPINRPPVTRLVPQQAISAYRAIHQLHNQAGGELVNRIDTLA